LRPISIHRQNYFEVNAMKTLTIVTASLLLSFAFINTADAQCACQAQTAYYAPTATTAYYAPTATTAYYAPTATTAYYAPVARTAYYSAPVTAYYAPAPVTYATPVTSYYAPVVRPGLFGWRARRAYWGGWPVVTAY